MAGFPHSITVWTWKHYETDHPGWILEWLSLWRPRWWLLDDTWHTPSSFRTELCNTRQLCVHQLSRCSQDLSDQHRDVSDDDQQSEFWINRIWTHPAIRWVQYHRIQKIRCRWVVAGQYTYETEGSWLIHDDVIERKHFPRYCPFVRGIHRSPVNSPHKGQWRGALMFSLICAWINGWVNNR